MFVCLFQLNYIKYIIVRVYRPQHTRLIEFFDRLYEVLSEVYDCCDSIVMCGDFSIDLVKGSDAAVTILNLFVCFSMVPYVTESTRVTTNSDTLIDNIFAYMNGGYTCSVGDAVFTDHKYQLLCFHFGHQNPEGFICKRSYSGAAISNFQSDLSDEDWTGIYSKSGEGDDIFHCFYRTFLYHFEKNFPLRNHKLRSNKRVVRWYTDEL